MVGFTRCRPLPLTNPLLLASRRMARRAAGGQQTQNQSSQGGQAWHRSQVRRRSAKARKSDPSFDRLSQDVDVIAFSPVVETRWEPVMREIKKASIPVVLIGGTVEWWRGLYGRHGDGRADSWPYSNSHHFRGKPECDGRASWSVCSSLSSSCCKTSSPPHPDG